MKYTKHAIILLLIIPTLTAYTEIQYGTDNTTFNQTLNTSAHKVYIDEIETGKGIDCETTYYLRIRHIYDTGTSNWTYTTATTEGCGEREPMAALAITLFLLSITATFFLLPFFVRFSQSQITDLIIRRGMWAIATFLMMQNTAILSTIATHAEIDISSDLLNTYLFIFGWGGYVMLIVLVGGTLLQIAKNNLRDKKSRRLGQNE